MIVCIVVVEIHILEKRFHVFVEEALNFTIVEVGVDEQGSNVRLYYVRQTLYDRSVNLNHQQPIFHLPWALL